MDAENIVVELCEAFSRTDIDELIEYFSDDAIYEKIPVGRFDGKQEIRGTLDVFFGPEVTVKFEILNISSSSKGNETKVLMERIVHFEASGSKISLPAMAIFEVNGKGKITGWRDYFDRSQAGLSP